MRKHIHIHLRDAVNRLGERECQTYSAWRSAAKGSRGDLF